MPFSLRSLAALGYASGFTLWRYRSETDTRATIGAPGYFNAAATLMRPGDVVLTGATDAALVLLSVLSVAPAVTTAALQGGTGVPPPEPPPGPPPEPPPPPPPTGDGDATADIRARALAGALASDLPTTAGLVLHLDAADPASYGGTLPPDASPVAFLLPRSGAPRGAVESPQYTARPSFKADFDGAGRPAIAFSGAVPSPLALDSFVGAPAFASNDQAATFAAVFRLKSPTSGGDRVIAQIMPLTGTTNAYFPAALVVNATGNVVFRMRDTYTANTDAVFTWAASNGETLIAIGRHAAGPTRNNRLAVRQGGTTAAVTATANSTATAFVQYPPSSARLGSRRFNNGNTEDGFFDGFICELAIWNTDITDQQVTDLISTWSAKWGVA